MSTRWTHLGPSRSSHSQLLYTELDVMSNFSFLRGGSHPFEYIQQAQALGYQAIGIADIHSFAGIVRAYEASERHGFPCLYGTRIPVYQRERDQFLQTEFSLLCYPCTLDGYHRLSRLLTKGKRRASKTSCYLTLEEITEAIRDTIIIITLHNPLIDMRHHIHRASAEVFIENCLKQRHDSVDYYLNICHHYTHRSKKQGGILYSLSKRYAIPCVATNGVRYHKQARKPLVDIIHCIREHTTIHEAGTRLLQNAEAYLKPLAALKDLFRDLPDALHRTQEIYEKASQFTLSQLSYEYPDKCSPTHQDSFAHLTIATQEGARQRYPSGVPDSIATLIDKELTLIQELNYSKYFLTCYDIVRFARSKNILCQGRGSAANSAVCYCLGITSVPPDKIDLLFARFVSKARKEPPDIDIDFEHERREEVIQYIYAQYGREHAALTAVVSCYRHRSALREVSKALGFPADMTSTLCRLVHRWTQCHIPEEELTQAGIAPETPLLQELFLLTEQLKGFPRHLSQHVGGFIISKEPLSSLVPITNASMEHRTTIEWDKDDIEVLGMLKIDILGLGMLSCLSKALTIINRERKRQAQEPISLQSIPQDDSKVYDMLCASDTIGVFQIESRAQMSMLPRLRPRCFYDLVIEVAIVRPGPIQGNMVHPYLRRREGKETIEFPDSVVEGILGKTLGVPIFQEQAMRLAIALADFSPDEAEALRKAMAAWKRNEDVLIAFQDKIIHGMLQKGYSQEFAETCLRQIRGFSEYGFPESHAASFALLVYASAWIKHYYPAVFAAALLNAQPMGFYRPAQIIQDARNHKVQVLPVDIMHSTWDVRIEYQNKTPALRCGFRLIKGISHEQIRFLLLSRRCYQSFHSIQDLWLKTRQANLPLQKKTLERLAQADAFASFSQSRRQALWEIKGLPDTPLPIDRYCQMKSEREPPPLSSQQELFEDYARTGFSLRGHPMHYLRTVLERKGVASAETLREQYKEHTRVRTAGIVLFKQKPSTAKGVVFITLEDETGMVNLIIPPGYFEQQAHLVIHSSCLLAQGRLQRIGPMVYLSVDALYCLESLLHRCTTNPQLPAGKSYSY